MAHYKLMPEAEEDLREIRNYITRRDSARVAARVLKTIQSKLRDLAANPGHGHTREDLTELEVLFWPVYSYLIIYRPNTPPLEIVAVPGGSEDVAEILKKH